VTGFPVEIDMKPGTLRWSELTWPSAQHRVPCPAPTNAGQLTIRVPKLARSGARLDGGAVGLHRHEASGWDEVTMAWLCRPWLRAGLLCNRKIKVAAQDIER